MTDRSSRVVVVVPPDLAPGFRLGGVGTLVASSVEEAERAVDTLVEEEGIAVIAIYEPYLTDFDGELRRRLERSVTPVIVPLPSGTEADTAEMRRARLAAMMQRAIGYHITFGGREP